jgi:hypothetical protein
MQLDKTVFIEEWRKDVFQKLRSLEIDEIEEISFRLTDIKINGICSYLDVGTQLKIDTMLTSDNEGKENMNTLEQSKDQNLVSKKVASPVVLEEISQSTSSCHSPPIDDDSEEPTPYNTNLENQKNSEYWNLSDVNVNAQIEARLQPQSFHHHMFKPSYFKANPQFDFFMNLECPNSASADELHADGLIKCDMLKENALKCRFSRSPRNDSKIKDQLCRMCPFKRWVPEDQFGDHMGLAHGIIHVPDVGYIALPPPKALFKLNAGRLKYYNCRCPKCLSWIRLGKMAEVESVTSEILKRDRILDNKTVVGLYTNYYRHFMECSLE